MFSYQPSFEWDIFFNRALKVKAFTKPKLVEFTDEKGKDALSETWQAVWPPWGNLKNTIPTFRVCWFHRMAKSHYSGQMDNARENRGPDRSARNR